MTVTRDQIDLGWRLHFNGKSFPATVPGTVHTDLIAAGSIRDIRIDGDESEMAWIGSTDFTSGANPCHLGFIAINANIAN